MFERPYNYPHPMNYSQFYNPNSNAHGWKYPQHPISNQAYFQSPFEQYAKPKQPENWYPFMQTNASYPPQNGLFSYFQNKEGQVDLDKMVSTVGQIANTVQQISPVVKQVSSIMKSFK